MDWMDEVAEKMRRRNQILFSRDSAVLQPLSASLANVQRRAAVLWALDLAEEIAEGFRVPIRRRPPAPRRSGCAAMGVGFDPECPSRSAQFSTVTLRRAKPLRLRMPRVCTPSPRDAASSTRWVMRSACPSTS